MPSKLGVDAKMKSPTPPPKRAFSRDREIEKRSEDDIGGSVAICTLGHMLTFACNLLITQLGSHV